MRSKDNAFEADRASIPKEIREKFVRPKTATKHSIH